MTVWLDETSPRARKEHKCQLCFRVIEPGETYRRQACVDGGAAYTFKACEHCDAYVPLIDLLGQMADPWDGYTCEDLIEYEPQDVTEARWRAQYRRKWRRRDGALYPIPTRAAKGAE